MDPLSQTWSLTQDAAHIFESQMLAKDALIVEKQQVNTVWPQPVWGDILR